jgi:hypothetical protein
MGTTVTPFYDLLLAKLVVHGGDREQARATVAGSPWPGRNATYPFTPTSAPAMPSAGLFAVPSKPRICRHGRRPVSQRFEDGDQAFAQWG